MPASAKGKTATRKSTAKNTKRNSSNKNTTTRKSSVGRASSEQKKAEHEEGGKLFKERDHYPGDAGHQRGPSAELLWGGRIRGKICGGRFVWCLRDTGLRVSPLSSSWERRFHMSNRGNPAAALKLAAGILAFTLVDSLIQLLAADQAAAAMIGYYAYGAARHISGGWLGGG